MKRVLLASAVFAFGGLSLAAKDFTFMLDPRVAPLVTVPKAFPGFGYVCDPEIGGEETALRYRHSGAWCLKTKKCDDATLAFFKRYDLSILLVLEGSREEIAANLRRIQEGGYASAIAGFVLGDDPTGGGEAEAEKWRAAVTQIVRRFPKHSIAVSSKGPGVPPILKLLTGSSSKVSHLLFDMTGSVAPYKALKEFSRSVVQGRDEDLKKKKIWVIAPDRLPGAPEKDRNSFPMISWKIHWMMSAYAVECVDAVIFNQPMADDAFGYTLRYLWIAFRDHPLVMAHGESNSSDAVKKADSAPDLDQDFDDMTGGFGGEENLAIVPPPKACAAVAAKRGGDVEYLTLVNAARDRMCVILVNTSGKPAQVFVDMRKLKSGSGVYRRMYVDPETQEVKRQAIGVYARAGLPFRAVIEPNCVETVTFVITRGNRVQAGY